MSPERLLRDWEKRLEAAVGSARGLEAELAGRIAAPVDAVFDLLEQSAETMRRQAEALESAGRALEEAAALMKAQSELFERSIRTIRRPSDVTKRAAGVGRKPKGRARPRR